MQRARPRDQELGDVLAPVGGEHMPPVLVVVPIGAVDQGIELDVAAQPVFLGDPFEVVPDLGLIGERVLPIRLGLEGVRVQVRRDVAGATGVAVVSPRAADVVGLLQDDEVHALPLERDRHTQTGESGPDDDGAGVDRCLGCLCSHMRLHLSHGSGISHRDRSFYRGRRVLTPAAGLRKYPVPRVSDKANVIDGQALLRWPRGCSATRCGSVGPDPA